MKPTSTATGASESSSEPNVVEPILIAEAFRPWIFSVHYAYADLILPGKFGFKISRRDALTSMWEVEYTHGSFTPFFIDNIGQFTEDRISLVRRHGAGGVAGFQWFYGAFYHQFKLEIGSALLGRLSNYYPSADVVSLSGLGGMIGLSYGWLFQQKYYLGIDAVTYSQPLISLRREAKFLDVVTNPDDRDKVDTGLRVMQFFPRLGIAKLILGYNF